MSMKGQTEQERSDRVEDAVTADARRAKEAVSAAATGSMGAFRSKP